MSLNQTPDGEDRQVRPSLRVESQPWKLVFEFLACEKWYTLRSFQLVSPNDFNWEPEFPLQESLAYLESEIVDRFMTKIQSYNLNRLWVIVRHYLKHRAWGKAHHHPGMYNFARTDTLVRTLPSLRGSIERYKHDAIDKEKIF